MVKSTKKHPRKKTGKRLKGMMNSSKRASISSTNDRWRNANWKIIAPLAIVVLVGGFGIWKLLSTFAATAPTFINPIIKTDAPDPMIVRGSNGTYYMYATRSGSSGSSPFKIYKSTNMVNWTAVGNVFSRIPSDLSSSSIQWAPDVVKTGDHYTMTYTGGSINHREIGYATSSSIAGPFTYRGVLVPSGTFGDKPGALGTIDSHIFMNGTTPYLSVGGGYIRVMRLSMSSTGALKRINNGNAVAQGNWVNGQWTTAEGSFLTKYGPYYYLYYSYGDYRQSANKTAREYRVMVARSTNPLGPFTGNRAVLTGSGSNYRGPGGQSIFQDGSNSPWMVYHAWSGGVRVPMIAHITYTGGWPTVGAHPVATRQLAPR